MSSAPKCHFIAFYSYKGGVGRTLALANCARALAAAGKKVVIIDLDLEAPGLELFDPFRPRGEAPPRKEGARAPLTGFAEYMKACRESGPPANLEPYFHPCAGLPGDKGQVLLMPAGRRGEAPYEEVIAFDWTRFYRDEDGYRLMEHLRAHIVHAFAPDYVLMDARTGLSETGGIATHQLADLVVLLFNLNRQNLEGTRWVHDSLAHLPDPPKMVLVASPIPEMPTGKGTPFHQRMQQIRRWLKKAVNAAQPLVIPYRAVLAWEERLFVDSAEEDFFEYDLPYRELLTLILKTLDAPDLYLERAMQAWRENRPEEARAHLESGLAVHPGHSELGEALLRLAPAAAEAPRLVRIDLTHLPAGAPHFLGRAAELARLDGAWTDTGGIAVVQLIAPGGVGKSALVKRWLERLQAEGWRDARRVFGWSFYSQGTSTERQASEDHFLEAALKWFGVQAEQALDPWDKGRRLAEAVAGSRTLLVLDGVEPLQYPPGPLAGELRAPGLKALLSHLAASGQPGLCLLSSREAVRDLAEWVRGEHRPQGTVLRVDLENLSDSDGARLLHAEGANRAGAAPIAPDDEELKAASRELGGHPLTLSLLGRYLALAHDGDLRRRDRVDLARADAHTGGHASRLVAAYESWFLREGAHGARELAALRLLGFFDRPADAPLLAALRAAPPIPSLTEPLQGLGEEEWAITLKRLAAIGLARYTDGTVDAHPLVREYLAAALRERQPEAWREGHRRLYAQLKAGAPYRPEGLAGLQPLYQAIGHGCLAGLQQEAFREVYVDRILRMGGYDGFYSIRKLGAFGTDLSALACFFIQPWRQPAPSLTDEARLWLLNQAAFCLRALGRLEESLEPMRAGVEEALRREEWDAAAIGYGNLSDLELTLGRISEAVADAGQAVAWADRSADKFQQSVTRTALADALHQQGEKTAALAHFAEAEGVQAAHQPGYPLLYSMQGFQYCDLLLAGAERGAWRGQPAPELAEQCRAVAERAQRTLKWAVLVTPSPLNIALDQLTLARCALYAAQLRGEPPGAEGALQIDQVVSQLRAAGQQDELPRGLLTRAWLRHITGDSGAAEADLTEAHRIAARGNMRLHLADIALTRARLFHDRAALAEARRLIEECGYGRRRPELEDAEAAASGWG